MRGPCAKQTVTATIVTAAGERFVGTNDCRTPQVVCPREGMASGVGYHLCRSVCDQTGHAEINALALAGEKAKGARLYLQGHTYACEPCKAACSAAGVAEIIIGKPISKAAAKRIKDELANPYDGIMYENGKARNGLWVRFRIEDVPHISAAAQELQRNLK